MKAGKTLLEFWHRRSLPLVGALAVLLACVELFFDWQTWIELNVSIIYGLPLILAAAARSRRLLWSLAAVLILATFVIYFVQIQPGVFTVREPIFINRVLAAVELAFTAGLLHALIIAVDALDARGREAEEASGRKTRLLASVSHDLSTPLTTINVMADLIRRTADNPSLAAEIPGLAQNLQTNALSLSDLVSDMLDISYFDSGRVDLHESEFRLNDLVAEECRLLEPLAKAKGLTLSYQTAEPAIWLRADHVKLARVLRNLVSNAIKFTDAGSVSVSYALAADRALLIRVHDTGVGITPENLEQIFSEFTQLRSADRAGSQGWGLGLAICRRLVGLMSGEISVESQPNRGSVFTVRLPSARVLERQTDHARSAYLERNR
jgi:signal transduction histidine kinase